MTDQIQITLDRSHVEMIAENYARQRQADDWPESVRIDDRLGEACRTALANPPTPGLREAAEEVDGESTKLLGDLVEAIDTYGDSRMQYWPETVKAVNHLRRTALSQTPEAESAANPKEGEGE